LAGPKANDSLASTPDETWIRRADGEQAMRVRALTRFLDRGGAVIEARLIEGSDSLWTIHVRLSGEPGEFLVNKFDADQPKSYKDVALAVRTIRKDLRYTGPIILSTDQDYGART
jgi:hypothetical protein